jgi:hypothetical protein
MATLFKHEEVSSTASISRNASLIGTAAEIIIIIICQRLLDPQIDTGNKTHVAKWNVRTMQAGVDVSHQRGDDQPRN